jgi:hypothetical protein
MIHRSTSSATPHDRHRAACSAGSQYRRPRAQPWQLPWAVRGPRRSSTARRCTKRHRRLWALRLPARDHHDWPRPCTGRGPGSRGYASTLAHLRVTESAPPAASLRPFGIAGCQRAGGAARLGPAGADVRIYSCLYRHRRPRDPQGDRGLRAGRRSCVTRSGHTDVDVTQ